MATKQSQPKLDPAHCAFKLKLGRSRIHRLGVFAAERIPPRRKVMEYTGEMVNRRETKRRVEADKDHIYLFAVNHYWARDGAVGGSGAEFVNHCCEPNCRAQVIAQRIFYFSLREIQPGEEITLDYNFQKRADRYDCRCGAPGCRGTINAV